MARAPRAPTTTSSSSSPDAVDLVERLVWHHDQPFGDSSAVPTFLLSELTREHVTVALSGDGGDELFAGYERFAAGLAARRYAALPAPRCGAAAAGRVGLLPAAALRGRAGEPAALRAASPSAGLPDAYRCVDQLRPGRRARRAARRPPRRLGARGLPRDLGRRSEGAHPLDRLLDLNLRTYLLDDLLVKTDRMSMAHGLEVRSPVPRHGAARVRRPPAAARSRPAGCRSKRVLKAAVDGPAAAPRSCSRPKRGFGVPLDRWFREDLRGYVGRHARAPPDARVKRPPGPGGASTA